VRLSDEQFRDIRTLSLIFLQHNDIWLTKATRPPENEPIMTVAHHRNTADGDLSCRADRHLTIERDASIRGLTFAIWPRY
jgi:hypothetical protein